MIAFVDLTNLAMIQYFGLKRVNNDNVIHPEVLYERVLRSILKIHKKFPLHQMILAIDGNQTWKRDVSEDYKKKRKEQRIKNNLSKFFKDFYSSLDLIEMKLKQIHTPVLRHPKFESDEVIAYIIRKIKPIDELKLIISTDKDFLILNTPVYNIIKDAYIINTSTNTPSDFLKLQSITGKRGDMPQIYKGVGEKRGITLIKESNDTKTPLSILIEQDYGLAAKEQYLFNRKFFSLRIPSILVPDMINTISNCKVNNDGMIKFFNELRKYGINYSDSLENFIKVQWEDSLWGKIQSLSQE